MIVAHIHLSIKEWHSGSITTNEVRCCYCGIGSKVGKMSVKKYQAKGKELYAVLKDLAASTERV